MSQKEKGFFKCSTPRGPSSDFHNKSDMYLHPSGGKGGSKGPNPAPKSSFKPDAAEYPKGHGKKHK